MSALPRRARRGIALVLVIWATALLTVTLGGFVLIARAERQIARHQLDGVRARLAAEAGIHYAVYKLSELEPQARWIGDGRSYALKLDEADVEIALTDESGKVDLNAADEVVLKSLFVQTGGLPEEEAAALADAILDWRDEDDLVRANGAEREDYLRAGFPYVPSNRAFATVEELLQVMGMNYALFRRIEPALTVHSGMSQPNPAFAPLEALMVYPGMTEDLALSLIQQRQQTPPEMMGQPVGQLPDGTPVISQFGGLAYSIRVRAVLPNGASREFHSTIRLGMQARAGRPFHVLRFREADSS